ncbi:hypothetical protein Pla163_11330 [Planctomycetes bacterium Pla163]|uniref:Uncharacterized protein n=1 Tax=Rohdeia mirabilis TaxID=2528008 RepID=A0A518CXS8_9BACT|nr:hypothetical protein Pla163_11330 [Planctomycetes bacterium Pla163]
MDKSDYQAAWLHAMSNGALLTPKHDPASVPFPFAGVEPLRPDRLT